MRERISRFKDFFLELATSKWGLWALFICAFADASFFPLPTMSVFLTVALLNISRANKYAFMATLASVFGALVGYTIGHFAWLNAQGEFTSFAHFIFNHVPGLTESAYNQIRLSFAKWDIWILVISSLTPVSYNVFSIPSGVFDANLFQFCTATLIGQATKFFVIALLIEKIGPAIKKIPPINFKPFVYVIAIGISIAFVLIKLSL